MKIDIKTRMIEVPFEIIVDDIKYPLTQWNVNVVKKYWATKNELVLKDLADFSLDFGD